MDSISFPDYARVLPQEERAPLLGLSRSEIFSWAESRAEVYCRILNAFRSIRNDAIAIHSLPTEILSDIFARCWHNKQSFRIAHVCRRWRAVVLRTPAFWRDVADGEVFDLDEQLQQSRTWHSRFEFMKTLFALTKLGRGGMRLRVRHFDDHLYRYLEGPEDATSRLASLNVKLYSGEEYTRFYQIMKSGMPSLKALRIKASASWYPTPDDWQQEIHEPLPHSSLPLLTTLSTLLPLFPLYTRESVEYFILQEPKDFLELSFPLLRDTLRKCQGLRRLKLKWATEDDLDEVVALPPQSAPNLVTLPVLTHLFIRDSARHIAIMLSHVLVLPSLTCLHISHANRNQDEEEETSWMMPNNNDLVDRLLRGIDTVSIKEDEVDHEKRDEETMIAIRIFSNSAERVRVTYCRDQARAGDFVSQFRSYATLTHLSLCADTRIGGLTNTLFRAFPQLLFLRIVAPKAVLLLDALHAQDSSEDPRSLVSPSLKTLAVSLPFHRPVSDSLRRALVRDGWSSGSIKVFLRSHCAIIRQALQRRADLGSRLESLEWSVFEYDEEDFEHWESPNAIIVGLPPTHTDGQGATTDFGFESLQALVDGPTTFKGFAFYPPEYHGHSNASRLTSDDDKVEVEDDDDDDEEWFCD